MSGRYEKQPSTITHQIQTGGEITVNLVLTIKLDGNGLSVAAEPAENKKKMSIVEMPKKKDDEMTDWIIPDIEVGEAITFGKKITEEK